VSHAVETADIRRQAKRRADALRLARRTDLRLVLLPDRRVRVEGGASPEDVAAVRNLRGELVELLAGLRCIVCSEPLPQTTRVPYGPGWACRGRCSGYARPPNATQVAGRDR
jgi:hypothetical protein